MIRVESKSFDIAHYLRVEFEDRLSKFKGYSLRRFAASLDLPVSTLSMVMSGKSYPKGTTIKAIARQLNWDRSRIEEITQVRDKKLLAKRKRINSRKRFDPDFDVLENLIPLAILSIANTCQAEASVQNLSSMLGVSQPSVAKALVVLEARKLIVIDNEILKATESVSAIAEDPGSRLVKEYVAQWLRLGAEQFEKQPAQKTNSMLFYAFASEKDLPLAKAKFENFLRTMRASFPIQKAAGELYCMGAVIFPFHKKNG